MNVRIDQPSLSALCKHAERMAAGATSDAILKGMLLEAYEDEDGMFLLASCTNERMGVRVWSNKAIVTEFGRVVIDADSFAAWVASLDVLSLIDLKTAHGRLVASTRQSTAYWAMLPVERFPEPFYVGEGATVSLFTGKAHELAHLLQNAAKFAV